MSGRDYGRVGDVYSYLKSDESIGDRRATYLNMSEEELITMFRSENWPKDHYEREWILQSMENHIAARDGRKPCSVIGFDQEYDPSTGVLRGEHSGKAIYINVNDNLNQYGMLKTLLHEDEHDEQTEEADKFINDPDGTVQNSKFSKNELESFTSEMENGTYINPDEGPRDKYVPVDKFDGKSLDEKINSSGKGYYDPYRAMNCELDAESRSMDYMTDEKMLNAVSDDPAYADFIKQSTEEYVDRKNWIDNNQDVKRDVQLFQAERSQFLTDEQRKEFENSVENDNYEDPSVSKYRETTDRLSDINYRLNGEQLDNSEQDLADDNLENQIQGDEENEAPLVYASDGEKSESDLSDEQDEDLEIFDPDSENNESGLSDEQDEDLEMLDSDAESNEAGLSDEQDEDLEMLETDDGNHEAGLNDEQDEDLEVLDLYSEESIHKNEENELPEEDTAEDLIGDTSKEESDNNEDLQEEKSEEEEDSAEDLVDDTSREQTDDLNNEQASELGEESPETKSGEEEDSAENLVDDSPDEEAEKKKTNEESQETDVERESEDNASDLVDDSKPSENYGESEGAESLSESSGGESTESDESNGQSSEMSM